jgi:hypothetical protein
VSPGRNYPDRLRRGSGFVELHSEGVAIVLVDPTWIGRDSSGQIRRLVIDVELLSRAEAAEQ